MPLLLKLSRHKDRLQMQACTMLLIVQHFQDAQVCMQYSWHLNWADPYLANASRCCSPRERTPPQSARLSRPVLAPVPLLPGLLRLRSRPKRTCLSILSSSESDGRGLLDILSCPGASAAAAPFSLHTPQVHLLTVCSCMQGRRI